jgi:hypothetical protein
MNLFTVMLYLHVLLFGFWIGSDIAVLYVSRFVLDPSLTPQTRSLFGSILFKLDTSPTICMTLMLPVGLTLAGLMGASPVKGGWLVGVWIIGLAWAAGMLTMIHSPKVRPWLRRGDRTVRLVVIVTLLAAGTISLLHGHPFTQPWIAVKAILFAAVVAASIGIDIAVRPYGPALTQLLATGPTPELNRTISRALEGAYPSVFLMYAAILAEAGVAIFWK